MRLQARYFFYILKNPQHNIEWANAKVKRLHLPIFRLAFWIKFSKNYENFPVTKK